MQKRYYPPLMKASDAPDVSNRGRFRLHKMNKVIRCIEDEHVRIEITSSGKEASLSMEFIDPTSHDIMVMKLDANGLSKLRALIYDVEAEIKPVPAPVKALHNSLYNGQGPF